MKDKKSLLFKILYSVVLAGIFLSVGMLAKSKNMENGKIDSVEIEVKKEKVSELDDLPGFESYFDNYIKELNTESGNYYQYPYYQVNGYSENGTSYLVDLKTRRVDKLKGLGVFDYSLSESFFANDNTREETLERLYQHKNSKIINRRYADGHINRFKINDYDYSLRIRDISDNSILGIADAKRSISEKGNHVVYFNLIDLNLIDSLKFKVNGRIKYFSSLERDGSEINNISIQGNEVTITPVNVNATGTDIQNTDEYGNPISVTGDFGLYVGYFVYQQNISSWLISGFVVIGILLSTILYFGIVKHKFKETFSRENFKKVFKFRTLYVILIPALILLVVFRYLPMLWLSAGFMDYNLLEGLNSEWVGGEYFYGILYAQNTPEMYRIFRNTIFISFIRIVTNLPFILFLALVINSMKKKKIKTVFQGLTMIPYFLSWVAIGGLFYSLLNSESGLVNRLFALTTDWYSVSEPWWMLLSLSSLWKGMGWSAIIYIAAMCQIDPQQYEAARIDGCGPIRQAFTVTLPGIMNVLCLQLILDISNLMRDNFDQIFAMTNGKITSTISDTVDVVGRISYTSLLNSNFGSATAIGLIQGIIGCVLVVFANHIVKKSDNDGIM